MCEDTKTFNILYKPSNNLIYILKICKYDRSHFSCENVETGDLYSQRAAYGIIYAQLFWLVLWSHGGMYVGGG